MEIYLFFVPETKLGDEGDGAGYAVSEDGTGLGSHWSSNKSFSQHDMGLTSDWHHDVYRKAYPDGYRLVWVDDPEHDERVKAAAILNKLQNQLRTAAAGPSQTGETK